jgi:O-antigen/teichoic acid export membrane protein
MTGDDWAIVIGAIVALLFLWYFWVRLPAQMARKRGRSAVGWVLLFWFLSPLWGAILLLVVGDSQEKISREIIEQLKRDQ